MNVSPSFFGPQPFSRRQRILLGLVAGLLVLMLAMATFLTVTTFPEPTTSSLTRLLLAGLLAAALGLTVLVAVLASAFRRTVGAEFARAYQSLEGEVLERKRAEETLRAQNDYFAALNETALALVGRLNLNELLADILTRAGELVGTRNGYVFLLNPETGEMDMRVGVGAYQDFVGTRAQSGVALAGTVWQTGEAVAVDDYRNWSGRLADPSRNVLRAVVGVPLKSQDKVVGIIGLAHLAADKRFGPNEMDVLNRFASLASIALENARLYESAARELEQRRVAETKLAYERDLLQAIMDTLPDLIFFKDRESRFVRSNAAHLRNLGASSMDEVFGKTDLDYHVDAPAHSFMEDEKYVLETGKPILNKVEANPTKDGTARYFSTSKVPWRDAEGNIIGTLGVAHDVTDRISAEQRLEAEVAERQRTEQFLDSIVENLPTMLFVKDAQDLRFVRWNKGAEAITGRGSAQIMGKNDYDFFPKEEADFFVAKDRETLNSGETLDIPEEPLQAANGEIRWLHTKKLTVMGSDGKPAYLVGIAEDITERKRAEQEFREAREFLETLVNNIPLGIFVKDARDLRMVRWNKANEAITGIPAEQVLGKTDHDLFPKQVADFFVQKDRETLARGALVDIPEEEIQTAQQGVRLLHTKKIPLKDANGKPMYLLGISEDITEQQRAEENIRRVTQNARAIFWRANVTRLEDEHAESLGFHWETDYANPETVMKFLPIPIEPGQAFGDAYYATWLDEDKALMDARSAQALREGRDGYAQEYRLRDVNGNLHWMYEDARVRWADATHAELAGYTIDITDRKRAEERVRENEALYESLVETMPQALTRKDREGRVTFGNQRFFEDTGKMPEELYGKTDFDFHPHELAEKYWQDDLRVLRDGETIEAIEPHERGDGGRITVHVIKTPLRNPQGEIDGMQVMFWDITEEQRRQELVRKQNAYLNALQETSLGLMQRLDVNALLQDIVARAGALVGTESGYVFLRDPEKEEMELRVGVGAYEGFVGRRTQPGVGLAGQVWETNAPVVVDDYRTFGGRIADPSRDILRAVAGVPLRSGTDVIGIIGLAYLDEARKFGEAEIEVLQRFAQLAAISLDNARLYETAQQELAERSRAEAALAQQLRETELLNRVTSHAVTLDVDEALGQICRDLAEYFGVEQAAIALLSEDGESLTVVANHAPQDSPSVLGYVIPVKGNPSTEIVMETRRPAAFYDAQKDTRLAPVRDLMKARGTASLLIAPLFIRDEIIGTIGIDASTPHDFTEDEVALVERVSASVSTALENARLYRTAQQELAERTRAEQETRRRNEELQVISRVSAVMTTNIDMLSALETLARELVRMFRARNCGIALLNEDKQSLTVVADALEEEHEEHAVGIKIPVVNNPSTQYVLEHRRSLVIPDAQTDPMTEPIHERMIQRRTKCLAIIPLMSAGEVIGTIGLDTTDPEHVFNDDEIRLAETMANQMANAIEKQRLFDQARARARREQLTREIGSNLTRTLDRETILQTMARELSHALGASHAVVRMGGTEKKENGHS